MNRRQFINKTALVAATIPTVTMFSGCGSETQSDSSDEILSSNLSSLVSSLQESKAKSDALHSNSLNNIALPSALSGAAANYFSTKSIENVYLSSDSYIWTKYAEYNSLSYKQFSNQFTKLTAALRLHEYKQNEDVPSTNRALAVSRADLSQELVNLLSILDDISLLDMAVDTFNASIEFIKLTTDMVVKKVIELGLTSSGIMFAIASAISIEGILDAISEKLDSDTTLSSDGTVVSGIAALGTSIVDFLGSVSFDKLSVSRDASSLSNDEIKIYLQSNSLQTELSNLLIKMMNQYITKTTSDVVAFVKETNSSNRSVNGMSEEELVSTLGEQSSIMTLIGNILKALYEVYSSQAKELEDDGFTEGSDASIFSALFGSVVLPQDELASESGLTSSVTESTATSEASILEYTTVLSNPGLEMESDAFDFAMQGMEYGYNFAMQGMEYGYLFASKGEDVGIMADRILFMAVQIGVMADRIGEMADRIVYTETLIVYTEMIILEFGLLIYGTIKMMTNGMLSALAIVFDREWYEAESEDQIVTLIGEKMSEMMDNMQEYSLAVLDNQEDLREATMSVDTYYAD